MSRPVVSFAVVFALGTLAGILLYRSFLGSSGGGEGEGTLAVVMHGPYRLLPPGVEPVRPAPPDEESGQETRESYERADFEDHPLYLVPLPGYSERTSSATIRGDHVESVRSEWEGPGGVIFVLCRTVHEWELPLDVYRYPPGDDLTVSAEEIGGKPAIVVEPPAGAASSVGYVSVWLDGKELTVSSPTADPALLRRLAGDVVEREESKE